MPVKYLDKMQKILGNDIAYLIFHTTSRCNAFCNHCFVWENVEAAGKFSAPDKPSLRDELSLDEINKISQGFPYLLLVNLAGGEPFLRKDIVEIAKIFYKNNKVNFITIPTNGFLPEVIVPQVEKLCQELPDVFFRLSISIDDIGIEHNKIRSFKDGYETLLKTARDLQFLKEKCNNFDLRAVSVFTQKNQDHFEELLDELENLEIFDAITVMLIRGNPKDPELKKIDIQKFTKIQKRLNNGLARSWRHPGSKILSQILAKTSEGVIDSFLNPGVRKFKCYQGQKSLVLNDIGNVFACEILEDKPLGNIRDFNYKIQDLLKHQKSQEIIDFIKAKKCACTWECAINTSQIFNASSWPALGIRSLVN